MKVKTLEELVNEGALEGKRVFIRADMNVPRDAEGNVTDDHRLKESMPAVKMALKGGAGVMVCSHLGRPKEGELTEQDKEEKLSATGDEYLQKALTIEKDTKEDAYHKAKIYYYLENYEKAQEQLAELVGEKDGDALLLMGKIALALEDPVRSAGLYEQYIAEIGETPEAYNGIALAEIAQEDYDAALAAIQKGLALEEEQGKQELYFNEIVAYEQKRDFATARAKAEAYVEKYPTDEAGQKEAEFLSTVG